VNLSVLVLAAVLLLAAVRLVGRLRLRIWEIMLLGAAAVLLTGQIAPGAAMAAINLDVLLFLFGMFVVGAAMEESGYLSHLSYRLFRRARSVDALMLFILFGFGVASAFLMNDTLAIVGAPVMLLLAKKHGINPKVLLLALCFAVTVGSVMSPIGNPQNLLIALNGGLGNPFVEFLRLLFVPTMINLLLTFFVLKLFYREHFHDQPLDHDDAPLSDRTLAALCKLSLAIIVLLVAVKVAVVFLSVPFDIRLTYIALAAAAPILIASSKRMDIMKRIDWHTLIFFAAMFVLMESVWDSGVFQGLIDSANFDITSNAAVLGISVVLSQLVSNVPLVMLYLPVLMHAGVSNAGLVALAAGSTIAGNLTIMGAASNVIVIQNAEKKGGPSLSFWEFSRIGLPLTVINVAVYWLFLGAG
jgi:Na+/H+ antiporter NhaD/arsenite permease-like protein